MADGRVTRGICTTTSAKDLGVVSGGVPKASRIEFISKMRAKVLGARIDGGGDGV